MRICIITEYFYPETSGGTPKVISDLARRIADTNPDIEIEVVCGRSWYGNCAEPMSEYEDWNGIKIRRLSVPRSNQQSTLKRLAAGVQFANAAFRKMRTLRKFDATLVGTNPPPAPIAAAKYKKLTGTPYIYLIHDLYPDIAAALGAFSEDSLPAKISEKYQKKWLHGAERIIALGSCMKQHLANKYQVRADTIDVIQNWADPAEIPSLPKQTRFRAEHQLDGFLVVYSGNIGQSHGLELLVEAAKTTRERGEDIAFIVVGNGAKRAEVESLANEYRLDNFRVFDPVPFDDYPDLLASADVSLVTLEPQLRGLAVPSKFYSILASGRPALALVDEGSEVAKICCEHDCGVCVPLGGPAKIADAVIELKNDQARLDEMGKNARTALEQRFTLDEAARKFVQCFRSVCEGGRR